MRFQRENCVRYREAEHKENGQAKLDNDMMLQVQGFQALHWGKS